MERDMSDRQVVEVYWNRTRKCWSLRDPKTKRVVDRRKEVTLLRTSTRVSQAGWERFQRTGKRTVHAYISGSLPFDDEQLPIILQNEIRYNPKYGPRFYLVTKPKVEVGYNQILQLTADGKVFTAVRDVPIGTWLRWRSRIDARHSLARVLDKGVPGEHRLCWVSMMDEDHDCTSLSEFWSIDLPLGWEPTEPTDDEIERWMTTRICR